MLGKDKENWIHTELVDLLIQEIAFTLIWRKQLKKHLRNNCSDHVIVVMYGNVILS